MAGKQVSKKTSIKKWKKGINNNKVINSAEYSRNTRLGIRLTSNS